MPLAAADAGALHALRRRRAMGPAEAAVRTRRRIRSTTPRCITCFLAAGSGCCGSTTASPAPGAALTDPVAAALGAAEGAPAWDRLLATLPSVADQFRSARADAAVRPRAAAGVPQRARRWIDVGAPAVRRGRDRSAALDRLSADAARHPAAGRPPGAHVAGTRARRGARRVRADDAGRARRDRTLVAALYATMADPPLFKRLSLLYFAAASFSEAARRLGRPELCARIPALRASGVRSGAGGLRARRRVAAPQGPARLALDARSTARSSRSIRPACSIADVATGIPCSPRTSWPRRRNWMRRVPTSFVFWSAPAFRSRPLSRSDHTMRDRASRALRARTAQAADVDSGTGGPKCSANQREAANRRCSQRKPSQKGSIVRNQAENQNANSGARATRSGSKRTRSKILANQAKLDRVLRTRGRSRPQRSGG